MRRRIAITTCLITAASFQVALSDPSTAGNAHSSGASTGQVQALVMARFAAAESESVARTGSAISGEFHAVSTISAKDAWAVGGDQGHPLIGHWNGRRWKTVSSANIQGSLNGVSAASADDIWAVGSLTSGAALIEHWDGSTWRLMPTTHSLRFGYLSAVSAVSATDVWVVGDGVAH